MLSLYTWGRWQQLKQELGLEVNWQKLTINQQGAHFSHLTIKQTANNGSSTEIIGEKVNLSWSSLLIDKLDIIWHKGNFIAHQHTSFTPVTIKDILKYINWAPHHIQIDKLTTTSSCATGKCHTEGAITLEQKPEENTPLILKANIQHKDQNLTLDATLKRKQDTLNLQLTSQLNKQPFLQLSSQLETDILKQWQGELTIFKLTNSQGLFNWLQEWLPNNESVTELPDALSLSAKWQLYFDKNIDSFQLDQGYFNIDASLPKPWPLIGIGYLKGTVKSEITFNKSPYIKKLETNIQLSHLNKKLLTQIPADLRPDQINLILTPINTYNTTAADRAMAINLNIAGKLNAILTSDIYLDSNKMEMVFNNALLQAKTQALSVKNYKLQNGYLSLPFTAIINAKQANIHLTKEAIINLQQVTNSHLSANNVQVGLTNLTSQLNYNKTPLALITKGPITVYTSSLIHPLLNPINWKVIGQLDTNLKQTSFIGKLTNSSGLSANITAKTDYKKQLVITTKTPDLSFRTTNIFAKTFTIWPELLEIATGKINLDGSISIPLINAPIKAKATTKFTGLSGIYDRSEFNNLSGSTHLTLQNNQLNLKTTDLTLTEANPGIKIGPLQFSGQYTAKLNKITQGLLQWSKAKFTLFSGHIWLKAGQINLAQLPLPLDLHIKGVQLNALLKAYPTEGLKGKGTLDGILPLIITNQGIDIKNGELTSRQAGFIQFDSPKIRAIGANNPNMKLVTEALENFQYTLLSSQVNYDNGKAILGLQIKGRNPDIKDGQAINLNINLEEDIPALMTTLQLSNKVNETIRQRVQKRLQQPASKTN